MNYASLQPLALGIGIALAATACTPQSGGQPEAPATESTTTAEAGTADAAAVAASVFDISELDTSIDACGDFNGFVNGKWLASTDIPADRTRWGTFGILREESLAAQHRIVENAAAELADEPVDSISYKIGALYKSGMDKAAVDAAGFDPIKGDLADIAALKTPADVVEWIDADFARGGGALFHFGSSADYKNAAMQIAFTFQGGLALPTPAYYTEAEHQKIRDAYVKHVAKLFELTGVPADKAQEKAANVLAFETRLAKHSLSRIELRDPNNQYDFVTVAEADKITPHFSWEQFFKAQGLTIDKGFSMGQPKFFAEIDKMLVDVPVSHWQDYLAAHVIADAAPYLSEPFVAESFDFNGKTLNGQPEMKPRWKRVLAAVNGSMGQALGQLYVAEYFPPQAKKRAEVLVDNVRMALKHRIEPRLDERRHQEEGIGEMVQVPAQDRLSGQVA